MAQAAEPVVLVASAEFILKSSPVRRTLEQRLIDDLKFTLRRGGLEYSRVEKDAARLVVFGVKKTVEAAALCSDVFGVAYSAPAELLAGASIADIIEKIIELAQQKLGPGKSFAIRCRRSTPSPISRHEVELHGGSSVLATMKGRRVRVDLGSPDVTFYVDLVGHDAYMYSEKLKGPGGLPLSAQWKILAVLDLGTLSVLATEAMMRRGCVVQIFIPVSNTLSSLSLSRQMDLAEKVGRLVTRPNYVAFVAEVDGLLDTQRNREASRRDLIREAAARFALENRFKGLVFGDISGDLTALSQTTTSNPLPTFYPLIGLQPGDLTELLRLAGIDATQLTVPVDSHSQSHGSSGVKFLEGEFRVPPIKKVRL